MFNEQTSSRQNKQLFEKKDRVEMRGNRKQQHQQQQQQQNVHSILRVMKHKKKVWAIDAKIANVTLDSCNESNLAIFTLGYVGNVLYEHFILIWLIISNAGQWCRNKTKTTKKSGTQNLLLVHVSGMRNKCNQHKMLLHIVLFESTHCIQIKMVQERRNDDDENKIGFDCGRKAFSLIASLFVYLFVCLCWLRS